MPKKSLRKKKERKRIEHAHAWSGMMNNASGVWQERRYFTDNSMKRDFMPNRGTH